MTKRFKKAVPVAVLLSMLAAENIEASPKERRKSKFREGIRTGQLTKDEAKTLRAERKKLFQMKQEAKKDGTVTPEEKAQLKAARAEFKRRRDEALNNSVKAEPKKSPNGEELRDPPPPK